jgi:hypothetical protein
MKSLFSFALLVAMLGLPTVTQASTSQSKVLLYASAGGDAIGTMPFTDPVEAMTFAVDQGWQTFDRTLKNGTRVVYAETTSGSFEGAPLYETSWETPRGTQTVVTPKKAYESKLNHVWRHKAAVAARMNDDVVLSSASTFSLPADEQTMEASWTTTTANGGVLTHRVKTPPKPGETLAEQAKRHQDAVEALQEVFPPEPPAVSYYDAIRDLELARLRLLTETPGRILTAA